VTDALKLAGQRALAAARRDWNLDIFDPPRASKHPRASECCDYITGVIQRNGWGFALPRGRYVGNGPPQWCGMAAGDWWREAGLDPRWLAGWFASSLRLHAWAEYETNPVNGAKNPRPTNDDLRLCSHLTHGASPSFEPQEGDILIVGDGTPKDGDHITMVAAWHPERRSFTTISGNGGGYGPRGDSRQGVSVREYFIDRGAFRAMFLMRPAFGDLLAERP